MQDDTRVCFVRVHLVEEIAHPVLRVIKRDVPNAKRDIAVINAGLHYGIGDPKYEQGFTFLKTFIREHKEELPHIIWKDTSPQHFEYENGYYWCGPAIARCSCRNVIHHLQEGSPATVFVVSRTPIGVQLMACAHSWLPSHYAL